MGEGLGSILNDRSVPPNPNAPKEEPPTGPKPDAPPFNFSATQGDSLVLLAWVQKDGLKYDAYFSEMTGVTTETGTKLENITSPYTHRGLTNGTTYYYILVAKNAGGSGPSTGEQSAIPMAGIAPPAPPPIPCSTIDGKLTVCVELSHRMITEIQSDQPVTQVTLRTSDPIEGDRDSVNVFMRGVDVPMVAGMGGLPGTATLGQDYTVAVTEPMGYTFPLYDDGFDEYTFNLSKLRPMIKFEIRMNDDNAAPPTPPMTNPRNENTDENITIEITGVLGSARSGDAKVRNAILDPDLTGGTIMVTTGENPSLYPLRAFPTYPNCANARRFYQVGGANFATTIARANDPSASPPGTRNCTTVDVRVCRDTANGCDASDELNFTTYVSVPTAVDPSSRFYMWTGGNSVGLSNFGTIQQYSAYDRFRGIAIEREIPTGTGGGGGGVGNTTGDIAIDSTGRMWLANYTNFASTVPEVHGLMPQTGGSIPGNIASNVSIYRNSIACRYTNHMLGPPLTENTTSIATNPFFANSIFYYPAALRSRRMVGSLTLNPNDALIRGYPTSPCTGGFGAQNTPINFPTNVVQATSVWRLYDGGANENSIKVDRRGLVYTLSNRSSSRHGFSVWARVNAMGALDPAGARLAEVVRVGAAKGRSDNQFASPSAIDFDSEHRIYVADTLNDRVVIYDACRADMSNCCDSAVNSTACSSTGNASRPAFLTKIDGTRQLGNPMGTTVPGNRQLQTPGALVYPNGISIDKNNYIWVVSVAQIESRADGRAAVRLQIFAPYRADR